MWISPRCEDRKRYSFSFARHEAPGLPAETLYPVQHQEQAMQQTWLSFCSHAAFQCSGLGGRNTRSHGRWLLSKHHFTQNLSPSWMESTNWTMCGFMRFSLRAWEQKKLLCFREPHPPLRQRLIHVTMLSSSLPLSIVMDSKDPADP